jgi:hypothetical protein
MKDVQIGKEKGINPLLSDDMISYVVSRQKLKFYKLLQKINFSELKNEFCYIAGYKISLQKSPKCLKINNQQRKLRKQTHL